MSEIHQLNIGEFFASHGQQLREVLTQAAGQPPTPPNPPTTFPPPTDSFGPHPDEFGFYVSFRFDQSLQQSVGPNAWGLYLSESAISNLASYLVSEGCPTSSAWSVAHNFVYATIEIQYLADCTLTKIDQLAWLFGGNPQISARLLHELPGLSSIGMARGHKLCLKECGKNSPEELVLRMFRSLEWTSEFAYFFLNLFASYMNGAAMNGRAFSVKELVKVITDILVTKAPNKSPIDTALPIHYIP